MIQLTEVESKEITGGGWATVIALAVGITFLLGMVSGMVNPKACN